MPDDLRSAPAWRLVGEAVLDGVGPAVLAGGVVLDDRLPVPALAAGVVLDDRLPVPALAAGVVLDAVGPAASGKWLGGPGGRRGLDAPYQRWRRGA